MNFRHTTHDTTFRELMEHSYSGLLLLDQDLQIVWLSAAAERIGGWTTTEITYNPFTFLVHPDDRKEINAVLKEVLAKPGLVRNYTFRTAPLYGSNKWLEATFTNQLNDPDTLAIVVHFQDVTKLTQLSIDFSQQTEHIGGLLETMQDGFITLDENLCYTYANRRIGQLLHRDPESLIGKHIWTEFPDVVGSATWQAVETAFREKKYVCNEDFYAPLQLWQENRAYPSLGGVSLFIRDITQQKKEEHRLKLLESVITHTNDAIMITEAEPFDDPGPCIIYVNEAFTQMTGYTAEEVIGKTPRILQGPKTDQSELKRLSKSLRKWKPCEVTLINYKKNGEEFWINFTCTPVADEKGWYTHWISVERDVTERKATEDRLRDSEKRYIELFQQSPLSKWVFDVETLGFLDVNQAALQLYGYTRNEFMAMNIRALRPQEELEHMKIALQEAETNQMPVYKGIFIHQKKNGELMHLDVKSNLIRYQERNARVVSAVDITDRLNHIRAIEEQNSKLMEISWLQSHVIRAPLSRIMGLISLLEYNPDEVNQILDYIKVSAEELDKVIHSISEKTCAVDYKRDK